MSAGAAIVIENFRLPELKEIQEGWAIGPPAFKKVCVYVKGNMQLLAYVTKKGKVYNKPWFSVYVASEARELMVMELTWHVIITSRL